MAKKPSFLCLSFKFYLELSQPTWLKVKSERYKKNKVFFATGHLLELKQTQTI